jgi:hypothetical protein
MSSMSTSSRSDQVMNPTNAMVLEVIIARLSLVKPDLRDTRRPPAQRCVALAPVGQTVFARTSGLGLQLYDGIRLGATLSIRPVAGNFTPAESAPQLTTHAFPAASGNCGNVLIHRRRPCRVW